GSTLTGAQVCDGAGTCRAASETTCDPFACGASACRSACATSADCAFAAFCNGGTCVPKKTTGAACAAAGECASGFCADGVCCDGACNGPCRACNLTGKAGACTPIAAGADPANECADAGAASCGTDGVCDGAGACRKYAQGTICLSGTCTGSTRKLAATCD